MTATKVDRMQEYNFNSITLTLLTGVLNNMEVDDTVRFGIKGGGIRPNYQVRRSIDGTEIAYIGKNSSIEHSLYIKGLYEDSHLSRPYTYEEIQELIEEKGGER